MLSALQLGNKSQRYITGLSHLSLGYQPLETGTDTPGEWFCPFRSEQSLEALYFSYELLILEIYAASVSLLENLNASMPK